MSDLTDDLETCEDTERDLDGDGDDDLLDNLPPGCYPSYYEYGHEDYFGGDDWPPGRYDEYDDDEYDDCDYYEERKESLWNIIRRTYWKIVTQAHWAFQKCPQCDRMMILGGHSDHIPF